LGKEQTVLSHCEEAKGGLHDKKKGGERGQLEFFSYRIERDAGKIGEKAQETCTREKTPMHFLK